MAGIAFNELSELKVGPIRQAGTPLSADLVPLGGLGVGDAVGVAFTVTELPQHGELLVAPGTSYSDLSPATPGVAYAAGQVGLYYRAGVGYAGADRVRLVIHDAPFADRPVELAYFTTDDTGAAGGNPYAPTWSQASYLWGVYERPFMPADAEGAGDLNLSYSPPGTTTNGPTPGGAPLHGDVTVRADGTFTYRPHWLDNPDADADGRPDGEPYRGWDRFEVAVTPPHAPGYRQWVNVLVATAMPTPVHYALPDDTDPPPAPAPGEPVSTWTPLPFDGTLVNLNSKASLVEAKRNAVLSAFAALGTAWQPISTTTDASADNVLPLAEATVAKLDLLQSAYLTYQDGWLELTDNAKTYQNDKWRAWLDNWTDPDVYGEVFARIMALPRDLGGLRPNAEYLAKITDALDAYGDAAGLQVDLAGHIVTVANVGEKIGSVAGLATGGVTTAAQLATRAGMTLLVRTVARNYAIEKAAEWTLTQC